MTNTPPDWVLIEAAKQCGRSALTKQKLRGWYGYDLVFGALCDMILKHKAFKQEVSDAVDACLRRNPTMDHTGVARFIIIKPDPLAQTLGDFDGTLWAPEDVSRFRAALEARGLEIREKGK